MKNRAVKNREALKHIQRRYVSGKIDRKQAKIEAQPVLERINLDIIRTTKKLNQKYATNCKPLILTFADAMRNQYI